MGITFESTQRQNKLRIETCWQMKHLLLTTITAVLLVGCVKHENIFEAIEWGNIEAVKWHLAAGVDVNVKDGRGITPLLDASSEGHKEIANLFIAKGANVNPKDEDGETPLDKAIYKERTEITDLLRKHGGKTGEELKIDP